MVPGASFAPAVAVLAVLTAAGLAVVVGTRYRQVRGATWFAASMGSGAGWATLNLVGFGSGGLQSFAATAAATLAVWAVVCQVLFVSVHTGAGLHRNPVVRPVLVGLGALALLPTPVEPLRSTFFDAWVAHPDGHHVTAEFTIGAVGVAGLVATLAIAAATLLIVHLRSAPRRAAVLIAGSLGAVAPVWLGQLGVVPDAALSNAALGVVLYGASVFGAVFARRSRSESTPEPAPTAPTPEFVLDRAGRVVDHDAAAARLLGEGDAVGRTLAVVDPSLADAVDAGTDSADHRTVTLDVDGHRHEYVVDVARIGAPEGPGHGWYSVELRPATDDAARPGPTTPSDSAGESPAADATPRTDDTGRVRANR